MRPELHCGEVIPLQTALARAAKLGLDLPAAVEVLAPVARAPKRARLRLALDCEAAPCLREERLLSLSLGPERRRVVVEAEIAIFALN